MNAVHFLAMLGFLIACTRVAAASSTGPAGPARSNEIADSEEAAITLTLPKDFATLNFDIIRLGPGRYVHTATPENQLGAGAIEVYISGSSTRRGMGLVAAEAISYARFSENVRAGLYDSYFEASGHRRFILNIVDEFYTASTQIRPAELHADLLIRSAAASGFTWFGKFAMQNDPSSIAERWVKTEDGIYRTKLANENVQISFPVNFKKADEFGMPKPYLRAWSLEEVARTPGTFYQETRDGATASDPAFFSQYVYVNPYPDEDIADIELAYYVPSSQYPARLEYDFGKHKVIFHNIGFIAHSAKFQPYSAHDEMALMFFNCKFFRSTSNALSVLRPLGVNNTYKVYVFDSVAAYGTYDGFNYHAVGCRDCLAVEINSIAYGNGKYKFGYWNNGRGSYVIGTNHHSNNGSTAHDGMKMLRVGGWYWDNEGPTVADVDTYSITFGTKSGSILPTIASGATRAGFMLAHDDSSIPKLPKFVIDCHTYGENVQFGVYVRNSAVGYTYYLDCTAEAGIMMPISGAKPLPGGWESIISGRWLE